MAEDQTTVDTWQPARDGDTPGALVPGEGDLAQEPRATVDGEDLAGPPDTKASDRAATIARLTRERDAAAEERARTGKRLVVHFADDEPEWLERALDDLIEEIQDDHGRTEAEIRREFVAVIAAQVATLTAERDAAREQAAADIEVFADRALANGQRVASQMTGCTNRANLATVETFRRAAAIARDSRRNVHCSRCGDTRGGPFGHETAECTWVPIPGVYDEREQCRGEELAAELAERTQERNALRLTVASLEGLLLDVRRDCVEAVKERDRLARSLVEHISIVATLRQQKAALAQQVVDLEAVRDNAVTELERWRSGQRIKGLRQVEQVPDGVEYAARLARSIGTEGGEEHDQLLSDAAQRLKALTDAGRHLLAEAVVLRADLADRTRERDAMRPVVEAAERWAYQFSGPRGLPRADAVWAAVERNQHPAATVSPDATDPAPGRTGHPVALTDLTDDERAAYAEAAGLTAAIALEALYAGGRVASLAFNAVTEALAGGGMPYVILSGRAAIAVAVVEAIRGDIERGARTFRIGADSWDIRRTSCGCGGGWAWLRNDRMVGCICHHAGPAQAAVEGEALESIRRVLEEHWLAEMICDHEGRRDNPRCACSRVHLGWHPTAGAAAQAWIDHVFDAIRAASLITDPAGSQDETGGGNG